MAASLKEKKPNSRPSAPRAPSAPRDPSTPRVPRVIVVGAGIIGLTTALRLAEAGFDVTVLEQENGACEGTSHANAGQLLYDRIGAMGSPEFLFGVPKILFDSSQGILVWGLANPAKWPWALAFLRQCTNRAWQNNTKKLLEIAHRSRAGMSALNKRHSIEFDWRKPGKIYLYSTPKELEAAQGPLQFQSQFGGRDQLLSAGECIEHEPALKATSRKIAGGVLVPDAEVGDCNKFGRALGDILVEKLGARIKYGVKVLRLVQGQNRVEALETSQGLLEAELFVLATGTMTGKFLGARFEGKMPITGVKGISVTFPAGPVAPNCSVADTAKKIIMLGLGDRVRVTGYGIFSDKTDIRQQHVRLLIDKARALMPNAANFDQPQEIWAGLRPTTPNDLPMIERAGYQNLYVNAGHGSLGWTLALGSAEILLDKIMIEFGRDLPPEN
ncbi:D-amino acid dehydrogenase small subunit [hydrothermal vent metagenome]|uniref:D-amino acid dehydrogenase small subunit n=1 Tax=hydrothermal vent metagenome TaxID=652676 RepID=A0A3B0TW18_9ZZZZ